MQHTVKQVLTVEGVGLHSGASVTMVMRPAPVDHGIVFARTDLHDGRDALVLARWDMVVDSRLCTVIGNRDGVTVSTIEHLMSALRGCGIDNLLIEINGPEVPIMDGSASQFVEFFDEVGLAVQAAPRRAIKVLKEVMVEVDGKRVRLSPSTGSVFTGQIEFSHPSIGSQYFETRLYNGNFRHDLADARTFGFLEEVEAMRAAGLALGGSLENAIVLDKGRVMNAEGLRFQDEFIRHKLLDAVGDLFLAGGPLIGAYEGYKASHALNNAILRQLFATPGAWVRVDQFIEDEERDIALPPAYAAARGVSVAA